MMRRSIVAIHAIHGAHFVFRRIVLEIRTTIFGGYAVTACEANPGNGLAFFVRGDVFNLVAEIHVPMDPADRAVGRRASADMEQEADGKRSVGFIREKVGVGAIQITHVLLGPMTLFAGLLGWAKILYWRFDGALDVARERAIE